jgi:ankyrin repeat protein
VLSITSTFFLSLILFSRVVTVFALDLAAENAAADIVHSNGKTALMLAAKEGEMPNVERLLKLGADVNKANNNGGTPIMYAALGGDIEILRLFVHRGADLNAVARNGWTALMIAAAKGFADITRELLDNEANPNLQDVYLWSPLMRAVYEDRESVVKLLAASTRVDINHRGENGMTALHLATGLGYAHLARILLNHGADKTIRDDTGRTPYDVAQETYAVKLLSILRTN